jgi:ABC-type dipeptide/oligopeptide/nickel transport system permease component
MLKYIIKRLMALIPTLLGILTLVFFLLRLIPGDPAEAMLGEFATEEAITALREDLGLNKPLHNQYFTFLVNAFQGDFGKSYSTRLPVMTNIFTYFPFTLHLAISAVLIATTVGIMLGVVSATRRNSVVDYASTVLSLLGISTPRFWMAIILILTLCLNLGLFPVLGAGDLKDPISIIHHLILPAFTLGLSSAAITMRMTRACLIEALDQDYIRTAKSKGVPRRVVIYKHGLRNALIPVATLVGLNFGSLIGGSVLIESVFGRPGLGKLLIDSIFNRDYPQVQACVFFFAITFMVTNLIVDLAYMYLDPRIRYD